MLSGYKMIGQISKNDQIKSIFHYYAEACDKFVGLFPSHGARAKQPLLKKCCSVGEPLVTLSPIWPARDLNLRLTAQVKNELPNSSNQTAKVDT